MSDASLKNIRRSFQSLKSKKILIYGTGKNAEKLLHALKGFHIVGILDRIHFEGELCGVPILIWDDIDSNTADILIIATSPKNYKLIFDRIQYRCMSLNIIIYGQNGQNLLKEYQYKYINAEQAEYFYKDDKELKQLITQYNAVSFDLFDTLIMRKVLEPVDVFDLVKDRIKPRGIEIPDFKKKRRTAEINAGGGNIYQIYHNLEKLTGMSEKESQQVMEEELACEKQCLIPRTVMVEIMNYAINQGIKVSIISDMYFPAAILELWLKEMGISGYDKLYVSCEYGVGKGNGIFEIYRQDVGDVNCLHIGDDPYADVVSPQKYGIDSYKIKSAYEMLKISSLRKLLFCADNFENRVVLGLILKEIFNNPFALSHTAGVVSVKTPEIFAKIFVTPSVLVYMQTLMRLVEKNKYEAILFTARDGYLFEKIYKMFFWEEKNIPGIYFLTSRKLCLTAILDSEQDILDLSKQFMTCDEAKCFLEELLGKKVWLEREDDPDVKDYFLTYIDELKQYSKIMKENYMKYIDRILIDHKRNFLFCELNSKGTIHNALNRILSLHLDGLYLYWRGAFENNHLKVFSIYNEKHLDNIAYKRDLLEVILTSPQSSVCGMDRNGIPIFSCEHRSEGEIQMLMKAQKSIVEFIGEYIELRGKDKMISSELPETALGLCEYVKYEDEAESFIKQKNVNDMNQARLCILNKV